MNMFDLPLCVLICVNLFLYAECSIPREKFCVTLSCTEPISKGHGAITYTAPEKHLLSFNRGQEIIVVSKSKEKDGYWGVTINGKHGYVPSSLIRETKVFYDVSKLISVPVQVEQQNEQTDEKSNATLNQIQDKDKIIGTETPPPVAQPSTNLNDPRRNLDSLTQTFNVYEGTTIYEDITPSPTVNVKPNTQTATVQVPENERVTLPPEVIKLNDNYKGQQVMKENANFVIEKNDENVKVESKDLDEEDEEIENDEGEEEEEDTEGGDNDEDEDEDEEDVLNVEEDIKNETNIPVQSKIKETGKEEVANIEGVKSQINVDEMKLENAEVTVAPPVQEVQTPPAPVNGWNLLNNLKTVPTSMELNLPLQNSDKNVMPQVPEAVMAEVNQSVTTVNIPDVQMTASPQMSSSSPQLLEQELTSNQFTSSAQTPPPAPAQNTIFSQFAASADTPPGNTYHLAPNIEPKTEEITTEALPVTPQSVTGAFNEDAPMINTPISEVKKEPVLETSTETLLKPPQVATLEISTLSELPTSEGTPPDTLPVGEQSTPGVIHEEVKLQTLVRSENTGAPKPTQVPEVLEPAVTKTFSSQPAVEVTEPTGSESFSSQPAVEVTERTGGESFSSQPAVEVTEPTAGESFSSQPAVEVTERTRGESFSSQPAVEVTEPTAGESFSSQPAVEVTERTRGESFSSQPAVEVTEPTAGESFSSQQVPEEILETKEEAADLSKEDSNFMSEVTKMFSSWFTSTPKQETPDEIYSETQNFEKSDAKETLPEDPGSGTCESGLGFNCEDLNMEQAASTWYSWIPGGFGADSLKTSSNTFLYLIVTAVTVLLFTLGHSFIEKRGKTGPLIAKINKLEQELLVTSKECLLLKDEIQSARDKISLYENSANDELVLSLQAELEESKRVKAELESSIEVLQQELDAATEAGLDLNKMLSEVLTQKGGSETLLKSVENLQSQLDRQQRVIDEMTKKLGAKNEENEALQSALEAANERSENLEEQLNDIKHNLNLHLKEKENLTQDLNSQITQLKTRINQLGQTKEKEIAKLKKEFEDVSKKLTETSGALTVKEEELKSLKEAVKKLKTKQDLKLETVFDVCKVNGELAKEKKENQALAEKLQKEEAEKKALADSGKILEEEMQKLRKAFEEAEVKKEEAEKKLEVLSTYFKEKETQLQKELGLQEALWAQKKGDEKAVYNMMKSLQEEVDSYKSQNETLKKEILDQERGLKSQMATLEQKVHENWVAARQAERKLEEAKQEMAQLRNRLTLAEKNSSNAEGKTNFRSSEELNGVEAASPIMHDTSSPLLFPPLPLDPGSSNILPPGFMPPPMFMPPPLGGFMPPPPFLPGDRRPPPLGRMSSPPLNNRFSPSSPADYPFERLSSPPLSPSAGNYRSPEDRGYRHRSPPYPPPPLHPRNWDDNNEMPGFIPISSQRDSRRDHKGSNVSSEHSSSESLDKSSRHSGRV